MKIRITLFVCAVFLSAWAVVNATAQLKTLPGSSARGQALIVSKGCLRCHRLEQWGSNRAPDLTRTPPNAGSASMLAVALWNHAPEMWGLDQAQRTTLTTGDSADLFAYFYSALYFAAPGDPVRGRRTFEDKHCADCHSDKNAAATGAPPVSKWTPVNDPTDWAMGMWNHSSVMSEKMLPRGIEWPSLSSQNVADLLIYLATFAPRSPAATFGVGEPEQGQKVFERSCRECHSFGPGEKKTIDLLARSAPATVTGYIAAMWNHAPWMRAKKRSSLPKLNPGEMPNLIAFLFSQRYFFDQGDAGRGRRVFESKNCARCHVERRNEVGAPDLLASVELYSPITMTAALWRHGPGMLNLMKREGMAWPQFKETEMTDLIAYLNSRLRIQVAGH